MNPSIFENAARVFATGLCILNLYGGEMIDATMWAACAAGACTARLWPLWVMVAASAVSVYGLGVPAASVNLIASMIVATPGLLAAFVLYEGSKAKAAESKAEAAPATAKYSTAARIGIALLALTIFAMPAAAAGPSNVRRFAAECADLETRFIEAVEGFDFTMVDRDLDLDGDVTYTFEKLYKSMAGTMESRARLRLTTVGQTCIVRCEINSQAITGGRGEFGVNNKQEKKFWEAADAMMTAGGAQ